MDFNREEKHFIVTTENGNYKSVSESDIHNYKITAQELDDLFYSHTNDSECKYMMIKIKNRLDNRPPIEVMEALLNSKNNYNKEIGIPPLYKLCFCIFKKENINYFNKFLNLAPKNFLKNFRLPGNKTFLHIAVYASNLYLVEILLNYNIDINIRDSNNNSVLDILEKKINDAKNIVNLNQNILNLF